MAIKCPNRKWKLGDGNMANKDVSVKNSTDKELNELIFRLRKERECLDLISSIQERTTTYNGFVSREGISSEEPINNLYHEADKTKTIKDSTDQELNELLKRLRKENEVQSLISDMKRKAQTKEEAMDSDNYYNTFGVSTEIPVEKLYHKVDEVLAHFGIGGMKWGKRKGSFKTTRVKSNNAVDYDRAQALKAKGIKNLSNDQINVLIKRINLEKQIKDTQVSKLKRGEEMAKTILGIGTTVAGIYALSKTPLGEAIRQKMSRTP
jgi:hypothetical protein